MNGYRIETVGEIYGKMVSTKNGKTSEEAAELAMESIRGWRQKEDVIFQRVIILDGSQRTWEFSVTAEAVFKEGERVKVLHQRELINEG